LAVVLLWQQLALVDADAGRRASVGAEQLGDDAGLLLVPVAGAAAARGVAGVPARHDGADARLGAAVVVVVGEEHGAEAVDAQLVLVAEVVADLLQAGAVEVAAPVGAGPAVRAVAAPDATLFVAGLELADALVADGEVELAVGADE